MHGFPLGRENRIDFDGELGQAWTTGMDRSGGISFVEEDRDKKSKCS